MASGSNLETSSATIPSSSHDTPTGIDPATVREQCERTLADPLFSNSKRYSSLLRYIVDRTLDGHRECLKERIIGIEVLGRSPDYNTNEDATVRVAITHVRKRLTQYFDAPEHRSELRIDLPPGSYVAEFSSPSTVEQLPPEVSTDFPRRKLYFGISILAIVALLTFLGVRRLIPATPIDEFWAPVLNSTGPVLISIGRPVKNVPQPGEPGADSDSDASEMTMGQFIARQTDYPVAELGAANAINFFLARRGRQSATRLAQSTTLSDLQSTSTVLLGGSLNQWTVRLQSGLRFQFNWGSGAGWIEDANDPGNRRWILKPNIPYRQVPAEYALITRALSPATGRWWIGMGGTSVLGTLAAQRMLIDPSSMTTFASELPKGWQHRNLQAVVEFKMVDGSIGAARVVASNIW